MSRPMKRPGAFLDRDGVLIVDCGYPHRPDQLILIPGAAEAVKRLNAAGYVVVIVTNQSGVARGLFSEETMHGFNALLIARLAEAGARIDAVYACPFHAEAADDRYRHPDHPDRKPNPGGSLADDRRPGLGHGGGAARGRRRLSLRGRQSGPPGRRRPVILIAIPHLVN